MKNIVMILTVAMILFSCSDDPGIVELSKESGELEFLTTQLSVDQIVETEKTIDGEEGGELNFDFQISEFGVRGFLELPKYSFVNVEQIGISVPSTQRSIAVLDVGPSEVPLEKPIYLSLKFTGLNIKEGDIIDFRYLNKDGKLVEVEYGRLIIDYVEGWALVVNAKIYQFARFGFTRQSLNI